MDVDAYLSRIGQARPTAADAGALARLHVAHLRHVPFENLDIPLGRPIECRREAFYRKIVGERRGGFCYELNGLFAWLLGELGFRARLFSARVYRSDGELGPDFDHMLLGVELERPWIADVGFGDSFLEPLPLPAPSAAERVESEQGGRVYRLRSDDGRLRVLERRRPGGPWEPQYAFSGVPRRLEEFAPMCRWQQAAPESGFRGRSVCSLATPDGRVTISNGRWIVTRGARREERPIADQAELRWLLVTRFGIELCEEQPLDGLLAAERG